MNQRSNRPEVRNPVLALPGVREEIAAMTPETKAAIRRLALLIMPFARAKSEKSWRTCKAPMAVYWRGFGVYAGHFARAITHTTNAQAGGEEGE